MQAITNVSKVKQGVTFDIPCRITNNGQPENLAGFTIQAVMKPKDGDAQRISFVVDSSRLAFGEFKLTLPAVVTAALDLGFYDWDVITTNPAGEVDRFPREKNFIVQIIEAV